MARRPIGVLGLDEQLREQARAWAERTARAQGLPARVEARAVLRDVAQLLGLQGAVQARQTGDKRAGSKRL